MRWQSNNFHTLLIEDWDGEFTVFQPDSGRTHYLNLMSMQMLILLSQKSATAEDVSNFLAIKFELKPDNEFQHNIEKILNHFNALGLIDKIA